MPLKLDDRWKPWAPVGNLRLPGEPPFAPSRAFELLLHDLRRYARDEVAGRSFLIAGHRGAGKTAIVAQAVLRLRNEVITASEHSNEVPIGRRGRLQRPMIVKLVGQSLLAPPPAPRDPRPGPAPDPAGEGGADPAAAGDSGAASDARQDKASERVGSALVRITIALYRALAKEIADGFAVHAVSAGDDDELPERLELAGQLALELDSAPDPAGLRAYWSRLGRLQLGVLWPPESDLAIRDNLVLDQGIRELIAVSTAAQAFRICLGDVTEKEKRQQSDIKQDKTESQVDFKDLFNRLGALGAGALAGSVVGASAGAVPGVGTGLLVWILSGATLKWSASRERKSDRTLDYEFLRDRTVQTLDRDLPLVIDRIRQAGLAPVFVIDELDKLDEADVKIAEIIDRLKHLVADYGFFCFLTGRDYFDRLEQKVEDQAYPTEHTYFSERLLVLNRPKDLYDYVVGLIAADSGDPPDPTHALRTSVFALFVMYRSKLNFTELTREIARWTGRDEVIICSDQELQALGRYRLAATVQLAVDKILGGKETIERFNADPAFAQRAIDALYYIPRAFERDNDTPVDVTSAGLHKELMRRMASAAGADDAAATDEEGGAAGEGANPPADRPAASSGKMSIGKSELRELADLLARLIGYLSDFRSLKLDLEADAAKAEDAAEAADLRRRADIVLAERHGLIAAAGADRPGQVIFLLDQLGQALRDAPATAPPAPVSAPVAQPSPSPPPPSPAPPPPPPPAATSLTDAPPRSQPESKKKRAKASAASAPAPSSPSPPPAAPSDGPKSILAEAGQLVRAIEALLDSIALSIDDLVACELLPGTVSNSLLEAIRADLETVERNPGRTDAEQRALSGYLTLARAFDERGNEVARALELLAASIKLSGTSDAPSRVLQRIARYLDPAADPPSPPALSDGEPRVGMSGSSASVTDFDSRFAAKRAPGLIKPLTLDPRKPEHWKRWQGEIERIMVRGGRSSEPAKTNSFDMLYAAADLPPGSLFRIRLNRMTQLDWSRAALAALQRGGQAPLAPYWLLFAALLALGFDARLLRRLHEDKPPPWVKAVSPEERQLIWQLVERAATAEAATLHIHAEPPSAASLEIRPGQPVLSIGRQAYVDYIRALDWLAQRDAFREVTYE